MKRRDINAIIDAACKSIANRHEEFMCYSLFNHFYDHPVSKFEFYKEFLKSIEFNRENYHNFICVNYPHLKKELLPAQLSYAWIRVGCILINKKYYDDVLDSKVAFLQSLKK